MPTNLTRRQALALPAGIALGGLVGRPARAAEPVKIGLVAALSGPSAKSGEGITRGLTIAIDEINARGGVLGGRMLELVRRDDESNPAKGQTAARELIDKEGCRHPVRRHRQSRLAGDRAAGECGAGALHGRMGCGDQHHPQRRQSELRISGIRRRRPGGPRIDKTCHDVFQCEEAGTDACQQWLGRIQPRQA